MLNGCDTQPTVEQVASANQLQRSESVGGLFTLLTLSTPPAPEGAPLHIYLGGDGRPWAGNHPARDPTGRRPLALQLMVRDPAPALFVGRPCYHQDMLPAPMPKTCEPTLWTGARYSNDVVASMTEALRDILRSRRPASVVLVGYSGGGTLATLIAPRLSDLAPVSVITLAANLDTTAWTGHHRLLPLSGSLNPAQQEDRGLPEVHFLGEEDSVVPVATVARYSHRHPTARFLYVSGFDHRCCWVTYWPEILALALGEIENFPGGSDEELAE